MRGKSQGLKKTVDGGRGLTREMFANIYDVCMWRKSGNEN